MTIVEAIRHAITSYIEQNGVGNILTRQQLFSLINTIMHVESNSFLPADYCYNRTNNGISFKNHIHLFELLDDGRYKVLGENYLYSGPVFARREDRRGYEIKGVWSNGEYKEGATDIYLKVMDIYDNLNRVLRQVDVRIENVTIVISIGDKDICSIFVNDETYKISTGITAWKEKTSYLCVNEEMKIVYYVDTIDECIGELKRLIDFTNANSRLVHTSDLSRVVSVTAFEKAYITFIQQANRNAISNKAEGSKIPYGFSEKPECDGAHFKAQYGQGVPSAAPYMNWWVVSIYYLPSSGNIFIGIEEDRYSHIKEMTIKPLRYDKIGNKKRNVVIFYSTNINRVNYKELYEYFILVCEEVMKLGLN